MKRDENPCVGAYETPPLSPDERLPLNPSLHLQSLCLQNSWYIDKIDCFYHNEQSSFS